MSAAHTPGPWTWWTSNSWRRLKHDDRGETFNVLEPFVCRDGHPDCLIKEADMALIAAAPDMLAALKMLVADEESAAMFSERIQKALAAIAKAEGRTPMPEQVKHTPGPWRGAYFRDGQYRIEGSLTEPGTKFLVCKTTSDTNADLANARLIAAAPDMLAALKRVAAVVQDIGSSDEHWAIIEAAQAAIASAEEGDP